MLARGPAISVLIFWRSRDMGYRLLSPVMLAILCTFIIGVAFFSQRVSRSQDLAAFGLVMFFTGIDQRIKRWRQFRRGIRCHSYYLGSSPFESLRFLPAFLKRERRLARFVDPLFFGMLGAALFQFSPLLGAWIIFSAGCVRIVEQAAYNRAITRELDTVDGLVMSEIQGEQIEQFTAPPQISEQSKQKPQSIPTGLSADIQQQIHRKK